MLRLHPLVFKEPVLHRGQGLHAEHRALGNVRRGLLAHHSSQRVQGRLLKQIPWFQPQTCTAGAADHLNRDDRITAQLKEIIVTTDLLDAQHFLPDGRQLAFVLAAGCFKHALADTDVRRWQQLAFQFAVRAERHALDQHQVRGHHVVRQVVQQVRLERFAPRRLRLWAAKHRGIGGHQIRHQLVIQRQYHGVLHLRVFLQARFDFAQLDAQPANFHLMVDAPAVFNGAIGAVAGQITGAIETLAGAKRVDHKAFSGQPRTCVIPPRQPGASQVQLANRAVRQRQQFRAEDVRTQVGNRAPDGHAVAALFYARPVGDVDGRFGRAVQVV